MFSDEMYDLLPSTVHCFSGMFVMTNRIHKGDFVQILSWFIK